MTDKNKQALEAFINNARNGGDLKEVMDARHSVTKNVSD